MYSKSSNFILSNKAIKYLLLSKAYLVLHTIGYFVLAIILAPPQQASMNKVHPLA